MRTPEENQRLNDLIRNGNREEIRRKRKAKIQAYFTAILVLTGIFVLGSSIYIYIPEPFNYVLLLALAAIWGWVFESN